MSIMNKSEKEIDDLIHQALSKEEAEYFDQLGEQNIPQMLFGLFRGKLAWMNILMVFITLGVFGLTVYTFIEMLATDVTNDKLEWIDLFHFRVCGHCLAKDMGMESD